MVAAPTPLQDFPRRGTAFAAPTALKARGIGLRAARATDLDWLCTLYASTRSAELAVVPWPEAAKRAFLDQQFALQHAHYLRHFPAADFLIVEHARERLGRLYLDRSADPHVLVDISLLPECRGKGIGAALIAHAQSLANTDGCALRLHVLHANHPAKRLYARLGFVAGESGQTHLAMRWDGASTQPSAPVS